MSSFDTTSHIGALDLQQEPNWNVFKKDKNVQVNENEKIAPKGHPEMRSKFREWDKATVLRKSQ